MLKSKKLIVVNSWHRVVTSSAFTITRYEPVVSPPLVLNIDEISSQWDA